MLKQLTALALVAVCSAPLAAQASSIESSRPAAKPRDPNAKICEKIEVTGSRLGSRKICMTAEQWARQRQDNRDDLERAQKNVGIINAG